MDVCSTDGTLAALAVSYANGIRVADLDKGETRRILPIDHPGFGVSAIPGSWDMLGASEMPPDDRLGVFRFDPRTGRILWKVEGLEDLPYGALAAGRRWWAACAETKIMHVGSTETGGPTMTLTMPEYCPGECAQCIAFLEDGKTLLAGSSNGRVWKLALE